MSGDWAGEKPDQICFFLTQLCGLGQPCFCGYSYTSSQEGISTRHLPELAHSGRPAGGGGKVGVDAFLVL